MIDAIITRLKEDGQIRTLVGEDNVFPLIRLERSNLPAVVVQLTSTQPSQTHDDRQGDYDIHTVEVTSLHEDPKNAWRVATYVRASLDGWTGPGTVYGIKQTRFESQATDIFEATEVHSVTQLYSVHETR